MPHQVLLFSQSDYLIQIVDINSHTEWQRVQIQISWLLQKPTDLIYTVCKGRVYPGSAGLGLSIINISLDCLTDQTKNKMSDYTIKIFTRRIEFDFLHPYIHAVNQYFTSLLWIFMSGSVLGTGEDKGRVISSTSALPFHHPLFLSFIFSTSSPVPVLPSSGRQHKKTHKGCCVVKQELKHICKFYCLFVCVEILQPSQPIRVMSSAVSLPTHFYLGRLSPQCG